MTSYELIWQGYIKSVEPNGDIFIVAIEPLPHCTDCSLKFGRSIDTYECQHIHGSRGLFYFTLDKKPNGKYLLYYAEREQKPKGKHLVKIEQEKPENPLSMIDVDD